MANKIDRLQLRQENIEVVETAQNFGRMIEKNVATVVEDLE